MKKDKSAREELADLSPFLAQIREQETAEEAPHGYFEQLPDDVFRRIRLEDQHLAAERVAKQPGWLSWLYPVRQPRLALAFATVMLLAVAAVFTWWPNEQRDASMANTELSAEDWETYVSQNIDEFDSELLWQAVQSSGELSEFPIEESDAIMDDLLEEFSEDELEEFFM